MKKGAVTPPWRSSKLATQSNARASAPRLPLPTEEIKKDLPDDSSETESEESVASEAFHDCRTASASPDPRGEPGDFFFEHSRSPSPITVDHEVKAPADNSALPQFIMSVLEENVHISTHENMSQYSGGGASACGLASLNAVRSVLVRERDGISGVKLLEEMISRTLMEEVMSICPFWTSEAHLDVDDISALPLFTEPLDLVKKKQELMGKDALEKLLKDLESESIGTQSSAAVITRPPEIVTIFNIKTEAEVLKSIFVLFDSHTRQQHEKGAAFIFFPSLASALAYLVTLFRLDASVLQDSSSAGSQIDWQLQLLASFSYHVLVAKLQPADSEQSTKSSSINEANITLLEHLVQKSGAEAREAESRLEAQRLLAHIEEEQQAHKQHAIAIREVLSETDRLRGALARDRGGSNSSWHFGFSTSHASTNRTSAAWEIGDTMTFPPLPTLDKGKGRESDPFGRPATRDSARSHARAGRSASAEREWNDHEVALQMQENYTVEDSRTRFELEHGGPQAPLNGSHLTHSRTSPDRGKSHASKSFSDISPPNIFSTSLRRLDRPSTASGSDSDSSDSGFPRSLRISQSPFADPRNGSSTTSSSLRTPTTYREGDDDPSKARSSVRPSLSSVSSTYQQLKQRLLTGATHRGGDKSGTQGSIGLGFLPEPGEEQLDDHEIALRMQEELAMEQSRVSYDAEQKRGYRQHTTSSLVSSTSYRRANEKSSRSPSPKSFAKRQRATATSNEPKRRLSFGSGGEDSSRGFEPKQDEPTVVRKLSDRSLQALRDRQFALRMAEEYDDEETEIRREHEEMAKLAQAVFECSICLDEHPEDEMLVIEGCNHKFCQSGLRQHVISQLRDGRFPILCPTCASDKSVRTPGVITEFLVLMVGISEAEYQLWTTLQLAPLSINIQCPQCKVTSSVDQEDYRLVESVNCPTPTCNAAWCKKCSQLIDGRNAEAHSCDGSKELEALMGAQRWKRCPGCETVVSKDIGCNHMTCRTPGCSTHFCYICGGTMAQFGPVPASAQGALKCGAGTVAGCAGR